MVQPASSQRARCRARWAWANCSGCRVNCILVCRGVWETARILILSEASAWAAFARIPGWPILEPMAQTMATLGGDHLETFTRSSACPRAVPVGDDINGVGIGRLADVADVLVLQDLHDPHVKADLTDHAGVMDLEADDLVEPVTISILECGQMKSLVIRVPEWLGIEGIFHPDRDRLSREAWRPSGEWPPYRHRPTGRQHRNWYCRPGGSCLRR